MIRLMALLICGLLVLEWFAESVVWSTETLKPNFLIIVSDDQRPDTIAALGNSRIETPTLDRMVAEGMTFTRAVCPFPLCVPSRAEILTGVSAFRNGVPYGKGRFVDSSVFWAETLSAAGYDTCYCGKWMNDGSPGTRGYTTTRSLFSSGGAGPEGKRPRYGHNGRLVTGYRGWTFKRADGKADLDKGIGLTGETSKHIADGAIEQLKADSETPFFLHVNFTAPHDPLIIPPGYEGKYRPSEMVLPDNFLPRHPFDHGNLQGRDEQLLPWPRTKQDVRREIAAYYAVIDDMDHQIGRILQTLRDVGKSDSTYVVFTSDHGLALGSHGLMGKQNMYEHTIGIPFLVTGPGIAKGKISTAQVYLRDLFPTTCELAGIAIPKTVEAKSFAGILRGEDPSGFRDAVYGYFYDHQRMIRTGRWKLIRYPQKGIVQLFDLETDPHEQTNLADREEYRGRIQLLGKQMDHWFRERESPSR